MMLSLLKITKMINVLKQSFNPSFKNNIQHLTQRALPSSYSFLSHSRNYATESSETVEKSDSTNISIKSEDTFASLLRHSAFMQIGNPVGKEVVGKIYHVVDNDLYIDFGFKFPCICQRPRGRGSHQYTRGAEVRVVIKSLELSQKFLGYENDITLMEAECVLMGLYNK